MNLETQVRRAVNGVIGQVIHLATASTWMPVVTIEMHPTTLNDLISGAFIGSLERRRDGEWYYLDVKIKENPDVAPGLVRATFHVEVTA